MLGPELRFVERTKVLRDGRILVFFGGNDYHRLSSHPAVIEAFCEAARREGLSSAGSRTTTGNHPLHGDLERAIARFLATDDAVVLSSGYLAPLVLLQAVAPQFDRFFIDDAAHCSVADAAAILPPDRLHSFPHFDPAGLAEALRSRLRAGERPLVLTDGVFPSTGELAPLAAYRPMLQSCGGAILLDDAHGVAVVGPTGKGTAEALDIPAGLVLLAGTLSKGFGTSGGFVALSRERAEKVRSRSLGFIGSTGMAIPLAAAGLRSIEILEANPWMIASLRIRTARAREALRALGFPMPDSPAPILSIRPPDGARTAALREALLAAGIYPSFIRYPGAPAGGHFRFTLSSAHSDEEIERLLGVLASACGAR